MAIEPTFSSLAELGVLAGHTTTTKEQQRRHYVRALHRVIDEADVVLLVLDARDPAGCRSRLVEDEVRRREGEGKRLVFVLNKIGACPQSISSRLTFLID
jgi:nuclear GTP-binding protein